MASPDLEQPVDVQSVAGGSPDGKEDPKAKFRKGLTRFISVKMLTAKAEEVLASADPNSKYSFAELVRREKAELDLWHEYCAYGQGEPLKAAQVEKLLVKRAHEQRKAHFHQSSMLNQPLSNSGLTKAVFDNQSKHVAQDRAFAMQMVKIGERPTDNPS